MDEEMEESVPLSAKAKSINTFGDLLIQFSSAVEKIDPEMFNDNNILIELIPAEKYDKESKIDKNFTW